jgi:hypothetical protein
MFWLVFAEWESLLMPDFLCLVSGRNEKYSCQSYAMARRLASVLGITKHPQKPDDGTC